jgi:hypothetical protein
MISIINSIACLTPVALGTLWWYKYHRLETAQSVIEASKYRKWLKTYTHWIWLGYAISIGVAIYTR